MRIKLDPKLQLRMAYTETRTRPGFGQLNPTITIGALPTGNTCADPSSADCIRSASSGNPDLKPTTSKNYDASAEYYFSRSGALTVGGFYKDVNGFINTFTTDVTDAEFGRLRTSQPQNGGAGRIKGIEAGVRSFLRAPWLPHWLNDFGGMVNYTYLDAKSVLAPSLAATLPGLQRIAGTSNHTVNLSGWYENKFISLRLSYNYRRTSSTATARSPIRHWAPRRARADAADQGGCARHDGLRGDTLADRSHHAELQHQQPGRRCIPQLPHVQRGGPGLCMADALPGERLSCRRPRPVLIAGTT
jgi:TonB-dependent receptor